MSADTEALACTYASLILHEEEIEISVSSLGYMRFYMAVIGWSSVFRPLVKVAADVCVKFSRDLRLYRL